MISSWRARVDTGPYAGLSLMANKSQTVPGTRGTHPDLPHLTLLVFEAVLEVVCVSLPGYLIARRGMFNAEMQKFAANLNVALFTPCLSMQWDLCGHYADCSLHQIGLAAQFRQIARAGHYSPDISGPDSGLVSVSVAGRQSIPLFQTAAEFRHCHGCRSSWSRHGGHCFISLCFWRGWTF